MNPFQIFEAESFFSHLRMAEFIGFPENLALALTISKIITIYTSIMHAVNIYVSQSISRKKLNNVIY